MTAFVSKHRNLLLSNTSDGLRKLKINLVALRGLAVDRKARGQTVETSIADGVRITSGAHVDACMARCKPMVLGLAARGRMAGIPSKRCTGA